MTPEEFNALPRYTIEPAPHGRWKVTEKFGLPTMQHTLFSIRWYVVLILNTIGHYDTLEAAQADVKHLEKGLNS